MHKLWYGKYQIFSWILLPFAAIYWCISQIRRWYLESFVQYSCPVPLIVIGNISVGGVGKTPLVIAIAQHFQRKGLSVGIVSRGYGASIKNTPYEIKKDDDAALVGDEPLLLAQKTGCPVVIAPQRVAAVQYLLKHHQCQMILSDDGLQHYKMGRSIEIAVIDGTRGLGNGFCLPAGPLREAPSRLKQVDFVIVNEHDAQGVTEQLKHVYSMTLVPDGFVHLSSLEVVAPELLTGTIKAIAGIGNPQRFYSTLKHLGIEFTSRSYPDHYQFKPHDFYQETSLLLMTEKDAVKCRSFSTDTMYFLAVRAVLDDAFWQALESHQQLQGYC